MVLGHTSTFGFDKSKSVNVVQQSFEPHTHTGAPLVPCHQVQARTCSQNLSRPRSPPLARDLRVDLSQVCIRTRPLGVPLIRVFCRLCCPSWLWALAQISLHAPYGQRVTLVFRPLLLCWVGGVLRGFAWRLSCRAGPRSFSCSSVSRVRFPSCSKAACLKARSSLLQIDPPLHVLFTSCSGMFSCPKT